MSASNFGRKNRGWHVEDCQDQTQAEEAGQGQAHLQGDFIQRWWQDGQEEDHGQEVAPARLRVNARFRPDSQRRRGLVREGPTMRVFVLTTQPGGQSETDYEAVNRADTGKERTQDHLRNRRSQVRILSGAFFRVGVIRSTQRSSANRRTNLSQSHSHSRFGPSIHGLEYLA